MTQLEPSPLAQADDAKQRRDIFGEVGALMAGDESLKALPWLPLRAGDIVLLRIPPMGLLPAYGTTYLAVADDPYPDPDTGARLRMISQTQVESEGWEYLLVFRGVSEEYPGWRIMEQWYDDEFGVDRVDVLVIATDDSQTHLGKGSSRAVSEAQRWAADFLSKREGRVFGDWRTQDGGYVPIPAPDPEDLTSFYDLWFEAGPRGVTVIREGAVLHGTPAKHDS